MGLHSNLFAATLLAGSISAAQATEIKSAPITEPTPISSNYNQCSDGSGLNTTCVQHMVAKKMMENGNSSISDAQLARLGKLANYTLQNNYPALTALASNDISGRFETPIYATALEFVKR